MLNKPEGIVVLSCFDGMSCGQIALERAGIKVRKYYASEIDRYAIQITQKNYPNTLQLGDIQNWKEWDIETPDLIIAGSPCQGFSIAGHKLNFEDPRSKLFFTFKDILFYWIDQNPKLRFLLENVQMKQEWMDVITDYLGMEPVLINSSLLSAQSRKRLYWANWNIPQPEDKGIFLKDVIESGEVFMEKSYGIDSNYYKGGSQKYVGGEKVAKYQSARRLMVRKDSECIQVGNHMTKVSTDNGSTYRKLSPLECERLQTVPENYTLDVSNTQRYKMLGNGWTVDVIAHIFSHMQ